ncbi:GGDEF-domain containing protein [Pseudoalteromonas sp. A25]|nr:GGDEF-domain containing protein [Pseudoalteromonas sp. A25]
MESLAKLVEYERCHAQTDFLTRLSNREHCIDTIEEKLRSKEPFSLFLIDLNNFKNINDSVGHLFGDKVLIAFSRRITQALLDESALFRMGGDEFILIIDDQAESQVYKQNNRLMKVLEQPLRIDEIQVDIDYSAGAVIYDGKSQTGCTSILNCADDAMYCAKRSGQTLVIYDAAIHANKTNELHVSLGLKEAIEKHTVKVFYQPIIKADCGEVYGVEALARWPQDTGGLMMPEYLIPTSENSNLNRQLNIFVINKVFEDLPTLLDCEPNLVVHINLFGCDFLNKELVNLLASLLTHTKVNAKHILFEFPERMMSLDIAKTRALFEVLIDMGFAVVVDDFGTGFSSFSVMKDLPLAQIKLDRALVEHCLNDARTKTIVETVLFMARKMGVSVVAVGVNNDKVADYLCECKCQYLQGFNVSDVIPLKECINWIESNRIVNSELKKY